MNRAGPATNPPSAPRVFDNVPTRRCVGAREDRLVERGAEHRVRLVEHEQGAVMRAHLGELVDRRDVAVHREDGLGHDDGARGGAGAQQLVDVGGVAVAVDGERRARRAGARR